MLWGMKLLTLYLPVLLGSYALSLLNLEYPRRHERGDWLLPLDNVLAHHSHNSRHIEHQTPT